jgi:hypothetical protein
MINRAVWLSGNTMDLYSDGARSESRPGHRISQLRFPHSLLAKPAIIPRSGYDRFLPNRFLILLIGHSSIRRYVVRTNGSVCKNPKEFQHWHELLKEEWQYWHLIRLRQLHMSFKIHDFALNHIFEHCKLQHSRQVKILTYL